jgi:hypothetical protein
VQGPDGGQVSSQLPDEQSALHGAVLHEAWQLPAEQLHIPPEQDVGWRVAVVPGSAIAGPPFGLPPGELVVVLLPPPHAT